MKFVLKLTLSTGLLCLCACTMFQAKQPATPTEVPKKVLVAPVGKNWQVIEEAPALTNERNERPAFQTEQSVQPAGTQTAPPAQRKIETPR
jgi:hypothetical protein